MTKMLNCACTGPEDGVPVVFFHGVSNSMLWWQPLRCELAAEGYRAIGVDSLGHGASPRLGGVDKPRDVFPAAWRRRWGSSRSCRRRR
ncbi:alpha/beta fold hydrolase [Corynebacterium yudongzhengii]|uniref:alpha/beta fold hydrolase n=1 Tax=Corynebacterium yudongzhengii TaxID=2080740 RepID=UPI0011B25A3B|nr:hypothetical protein [Corynebacterium yudongzhengii]